MIIRKLTLYSLAFAIIALPLAGLAGQSSVSDSSFVVLRRMDQNEALELVVKGNNEFALQLYARLRAEPGNIFFSPYSISTALAMTYAGAKGETGSQMARVLQFPAQARKTETMTQQPRSELVESKFHSAFGKIVKSLNERAGKGNYELTVANALWGQKGYKLLDDFLKLIGTEYGGQLTQVDFTGAAETARKTINRWIEKETKNKIKELIKPGVLDAMTRLVLTNAIYFKGKWASQFKKEQTENAPFALLNGERIEVPMMNQTGEFKYTEGEDFQALELLYIGEELSMIILLPKKNDGLPEFEKTLNLENLSQWQEKLYRREVIVSLPKFEMTSEFSLASVLKSMGMTDAFSPTAADFSGITGSRDLFISAVIHKAYVDVNEEGTEAAAATGVVMRLTSIGPTQTPIFRADHPFIFLIRDNSSGSILFIGRVMNPKT